MRESCHMQSDGKPCTIVRCKSDGNLCTVVRYKVMESCTQLNDATLWKAGQRPFWVSLFWLRLFWLRPLWFRGNFDLKPTNDMLFVFFSDVYIYTCIHIYTQANCTIESRESLHSDKTKMY